MKQFRPFIVVPYGLIGKRYSSDRKEFLSEALYGSKFDSKLQSSAEKPKTKPSYKYKKHPKSQRRRGSLNMKRWKQLLIFETTATQKP